MALRDADFDSNSALQDMRGMGVVVLADNPLQAEVGVVEDTARLQPFASGHSGVEAAVDVADPVALYPPPENAPVQASSVIFHVFPDVLAIGRLPPPVHAILQFVLIICALGQILVMPPVLAFVAGYAKPSALQYIIGTSHCVGTLCNLGVLQSLRRAVASTIGQSGQADVLGPSLGGLALLGGGQKQISQEVAKSLAKWRVQLYCSMAPYLCLPQA
eukprot:SAG31_NODE_457_length_15415_cov_4.380387_13_plen_217_part_00